MQPTTYMLFYITRMRTVRNGHYPFMNQNCLNDLKNEKMVKMSWQIKRQLIHEYRRKFHLRAKIEFFYNMAHFEEFPAILIHKIQIN